MPLNKLIVVEAGASLLELTSQNRGTKAKRITSCDHQQPCSSSGLTDISIRAHGRNENQPYVMVISFLFFFKL